jgi:hypothetical protein
MYIRLSYVTNLVLDERVFKDSAILGRDLLDALGRDLLLGVLTESAATNTPVDVLEAAAISCSDLFYTGLTPVQVPTCTNGAHIVAVTVVITYANGSLVWMSPSLPSAYPPDLPATLADSIPNYMQALSAVMLMDIGIWKNNSIFASDDMFLMNISQNSAIDTVMRQKGSFLPPVFVHSFLPLASAALQLREDPSRFVVPVGSRNPAIIAMSYLCHDQRMKSAFGFIVCQCWVL